MIDHLFFEIAAVMVTAGIVSLIVSKMRQPLIIAYILTGLLAGPALFGFADNHTVFEAFSEIGIAFLLFLVGLNLNWHGAKEVRKIAVIAGVGQVLFTSAAGFGLATWLGFDVVTSLLLGIAFALSSTIVIVKLLSDNEDIDRFHGRISVGILIVQDIVAMLALLIVSSIGTTESSLGVLLAGVAMKGAGVLFVLWLLARYVLPSMMKYAARSQELLFLTAMAWCFGLASALHLIGFGVEIGALLAGISLASSGFARQVTMRIRPLRDFFLIIFF